MGSGDLNSGLRTRKTSALSTEPSLQPSYVFSFNISLKRAHSIMFKAIQDVIIKRSWQQLEAASGTPSTVKTNKSPNPRAMDECKNAAA